MSAWFLFQRLRERIEDADISPEELVETLEGHPDIKALWVISQHKALKKEGRKWQS